MKKLETRMDREFAEIRGRFEAIDERFERVDERFNGIDSRLETITRALANEIMQGKYVVAGIDQRFAEIERRLAAARTGSVDRGDWIWPNQKTTRYDCYGKSAAREKNWRNG